MNIPDFPNHILNLYEATQNMYLMDAIKVSHPKYYRVMSTNHHNLVEHRELIDSAQDYMMRTLDDLLLDALQDFLPEPPPCSLEDALNDLHRQSQLRDLMHNGEYI